jgi:hypothetical protein
VNLEIKRALDALTSLLSGKQDTLVSGTNIKTINGSSVLGSGNLVISGSGGGITAVTLNVATPEIESVVTVVDAAITATDKINVSWGNCFQSDENHPGMGEVEFNAVAGTGNFFVTLYSTDNSMLFGAYKINYSVAA